MSVQLIVYPQNYQGFDNALAGVDASANLILDGINFSTINSVPNVDVSSSLSWAVVFIDVWATQPPVINSWRKFRTLNFLPPQADESGGKLFLYANSGGTNCGVYQRMTGLTVGQTYLLNIKSDSIPNGKYRIALSHQGNLITASTNNIPSTSFNWTINATHTEMDITIGFYSSITTHWAINKISVLPQGWRPSGAVELMGDGQVLVDLYDDEDIPLSLSVDNFLNAAEKVQSYSKAFKIPATKRNNQIFDNMFEITRSIRGANFNPYLQTKCTLKQDGILLFQGYLKMLSINDKNGEISYDINLYSEVIAFADVLGERTFNDIDFTELDHVYGKLNIVNSTDDAGAGPGIDYLNANTSGFRNSHETIKYPFVDWTHQYDYTSAGRPNISTLESTFRPWINLVYLINRIFEGTDFTYNSDFFQTDDFKRLYMDFNWGSDNAPVGQENESFTYDLMSSNDQFFEGPNWDLLEFPWNPQPIGQNVFYFTATAVNQYVEIDYSLDFNVSGTGGTVRWRWIHANGLPDDIIASQSYSNGFTPTNFTEHNMFVGNFNILMQPNDILAVEAIGSFPTGTFWQWSKYGYTGGTTFIVQPSINHINVILGVTAITQNIMLQTLRGDLGQWEFLKGLMTMFNLVALPQENANEIRFEPYADVFIDNPNGTTLEERKIKLDWTDKIDVSEMKLKPLTDLKRKTIFKFVEDDDDYCFNQYKAQVEQHLYGSTIYDASDLTLLEGEEEVIAEPFAATIIAPLLADTQYADLIIPKLYARDDAGVTEGFDNSPRIMYNIGRVTTAQDYKIPAQNNQTSALMTTFCQFAHLTDVPTVTNIPTQPSDTSDFHFGECQLISPIGQATPKNLFNIYWLPYYAELYNPDTRIMTIKVNLNSGDINTFKFNDIVYLKNRSFRVNKIEYKPNDLAKVEFILIP